jgi:hypothetical protein
MDSNHPLPPSLYHRIRARLEWARQAGETGAVLIELNLKDGQIRTWRIRNTELEAEGRCPKPS